jgi:Ca2+/Na+ antiporter
MSETIQATQQSDNKLIFQFSYLPIFIDYVLRWALLGLWRLGAVSEWVFWVGQIIAVPLLVLWWTSSRADKIKKKYNISLPDRINPEDTRWSLLFALFVVFSGCYITFSLVNGRLNFWGGIVVTWLIVFVTFMIYGFYVIILYTDSFQSNPKEKRREGLESIEEWVEDEIGVIDRNDVEIVEMETEIISISQRVDTYTLESALFGALAFSGFLTLVASDKPVLADVQNFLAGLSEIANWVMLSRISALGASPVVMLTKDNLIAAITLETLICSMFFLSVVVSRIRLNDVLKRADYAVRVARAYNNKEEETHDLKLQNPTDNDGTLGKRLEFLGKRITEAIASAKPLFRELWAIVDYMRVFRNLGIGSFVFILVTSAFWVWTTLGLIFTILSLLAYTYTAIDELTRKRRVGSILFFQRQGKILSRVLHQ